MASPGSIPGTSLSAAWSTNGWSSGSVWTESRKSRIRSRVGWSNRGVSPPAGRPEYESGRAQNVDFFPGRPQRFQGGIQQVASSQLADHVVVSQEDHRIIPDITELF